VPSSANCFADIGELMSPPSTSASRQQLQRFCDRKQLVGIHVQFVGQHRQVGVAAKRRAASVSMSPDKRLAETAAGAV